MNILKKILIIFSAIFIIASALSIENENMIYSFVFGGIGLFWLSVLGLLQNLINKRR